MQKIHELLIALQGQWQGQEQIAETPWGPGGLAQASINNHPALNGALIQDYASTRDNVPWLSAHAVFVPLGDDQVNLFWFDSFGFTPSEPASGQINSQGSLEIIRRSPRGMTRHSYDLIDANTYELKLESSFDGGTSWALVAQGTYHRQFKQ